mmetsp:Transcript_34482/g.42507  ORF Transcript_34482/g.42507 Transcript_34482/m.42507 type:complete len:465 (+) Transcript_34482:117-1511(+)
MLAPLLYSFQKKPLIFQSYCFKFKHQNQNEQTIQNYVFRQSNLRAWIFYSCLWVTLRVCKMNIIEDRILETVPYVYRTVARLERTGALAKLSVIAPLLLLVINIVMYVHITELEVLRLKNEKAKVIVAESNSISATPHSYSLAQDEKILSSDCKAYDQDLNCIVGEPRLEENQNGIFGGESKGNLYQEYVSASEDEDSRSQQENYEYYEDVYVDEEDDVASDYLNAIETARELKLYGKYIDSQPLLRPGVVLANIDNYDSPQQHTLVLLTSHGGSKKSVGYVVNVRLNEKEAERARTMLRESTDEYESGSQSVDEEDDIVYKERFPRVGSKLRSEKVRGLMNPNEKGKKLWLGVGGADRDDSEAWAHIHTCTNADINDGQMLKAEVGLAIGGDIVHVLQEFHQNMCRLKILYGFTAWAPGQLDSEVTKNRWRILEKIDVDILFDESSNQTQVWQQGILSMGSES